VYRWGFRLPDTNWVHSLSRWLHGPDIAIVSEEDYGPPDFFWCSRHLDELELGAALNGRATALKAIFDGALYIARQPNFHPLPLGELVNLREDRRAGYYERADPVYPFSSALVTSTTALDVPGKGDADYLMFKARTDDVVRKMLEWVGYRGVSFTSLYGLRDFMNTAGTTDAEIAALAETTNSQITLFRRTANSHDAVGHDSRHGPLSQDPPATPMPLSKAAELIFKACQAFIEARP
jgi:hypothetical protein